MSRYLVNKFLFTIDRDPELVERYRAEAVIDTFVASAGASLMVGMRPRENRMMVVPTYHVIGRGTKRQRVRRARVRGALG